MSDVRFEIWEIDRPGLTDMCVVVEGSQERVWAEALHYAMVYGQDGPVMIKGPMEGR